MIAESVRHQVLNPVTDCVFKRKCLMKNINSFKKEPKKTSLLQMKGLIKNYCQIQGRKFCAYLIMHQASFRGAHYTILCTKATIV